MSKIEPEKRIPLPNQNDLDVLEEEEENFEASSPRHRIKLRNDQSPDKEIEIKDRLLAIIRREDRSQQDCKFLLDNLRHYSFMKRLFPMGAEEDVNQDTLLDMFKKMNYEFIPRGQTVYVQGDPSNEKMYIIIVGEVGFLEKELDTKGRPTVDKAEFTRKLVRRNSIISKSALNTLKSHMSKGGKNSPSNKKTRRKDSMASNYSSEMNELDLSMESSTMTNFGKDGTVKYPSHTDVELPSVKREKLRSLSSLDRIEKSETAKNLKMISGISKAKIAFKSAAKRKLLLKQNLAKYGNLKFIYQEGAYFGEQILFSKVKRNNTAVAMRNTDLLVLEKEDFKQIKYLVQEKHENFKKFIKGGFPSLENHISDRLLERIISTIRDDVFHKDQIVVYEGEPSKCIYLIYEGTVEVSKGIVSYEPDSQKINNIDNRKKSRTTQKVLLAKLEAGTIFCEEAIFYPNKPVDFTVKCVSQSAIIYKVNFREFRDKFPEAVIRAIYERYEEKLKKYFFLIKYALLSRFTDYEPIVHDEFLHFSRVDKINLIQIHDIKNIICLRKLYLAAKVKDLDYLALLRPHHNEPDVNRLKAPRQKSKPVILSSQHEQTYSKSPEIIPFVVNPTLDSLDVSKIHVQELDKGIHHTSFRLPRKSTLLSKILDNSTIDEGSHKFKSNHFSKLLITQEPELDHEEINHHNEILEHTIYHSFQRTKQFKLLSPKNNYRLDIPSPSYEMGGVDMYQNDRRNTIQSLSNFNFLSVSQNIDFLDSKLPIHPPEAKTIHSVRSVTKLRIPTKEPPIPPPEEYEEPRFYTEPKGEDTKRIEIIHNVRLKTHNHAHIFPLSRTHKRVVSHGETSAMTMNNELIKRTWKEYHDLADTFIDKEQPDEDFVSNLENFRADFGNGDRDRLARAAKLQLRKYFHPVKEKAEKIGDDSSHLRTISHRVNQSVSKYDKLGFPTLTLSPKEYREDDPITQGNSHLNSQLKSYPSKKRFASPIVSPIPYDISNDLIEPKEISKYIAGRKSDMFQMKDDTFMTMPEQSTEQTSNIIKNSQSVRKTVNDIIRHKKKINEMIKQRAKLARPDLNLSNTKYNPKKSVILQGRSPFFV